MKNTKTLFPVYWKNVYTACAIVMALMISACKLGDTVDKVIDQTNFVTDKTISSLEKAITTINDNSQSWQIALEDLEKDLVEDAEKLIRGEVSNLLQESIGAANSSINCLIDIIPAKVKNSLEVMLANLKEEAPPVPSPTICNTNLKDIDLDLDENVWSTLAFYGRDFEDCSVFSLHLIDANETGNETRLEGNFFAKQSRYQMTANLSGQRDELLKYRQLELRFNGETLSTFNIKLPPLPPKPDSIQTLVSVNSIGPYTPPLVHGDRETNGNGPEIVARAEFKHDETKVYVRMYMWAGEIKNPADHPKRSIGEGYSPWYEVYTVEHGFKILKIIDSKQIEIRYTDIDHGIDRTSVPRADFFTVGDAGGDDIGIHTRIEKITFKTPLKVLIQEIH